ncbi:extensin-like [Zingiber officinale]|uniref:extensin-like n=1 Tax=Zingiber officinale TaxID=94328 RepID=UPI001C4C7FC1|nr:extensin-like [Zingiber officinale]
MGVQTERSTTSSPLPLLINLCIRPFRDATTVLSGIGSNGLRSLSRSPDGEQKHLMATFQSIAHAPADPFLLPPPSSRRSRRPLPPSSSCVAPAVDPFLLPPPTSRQPPTPSSFIATAADPFLLHRDSRRSLPPPSLRQHPPTPYSPSSSLLLHRDSTRRGNFTDAEISPRPKLGFRPLPPSSLSHLRPPLPSSRFRHEQNSARNRCHQVILKGRVEKGRVFELFSKISDCPSTGSSNMR